MHFLLHTEDMVLLLLQLPMLPLHFRVQLAIVSLQTIYLITQLPVIGYLLILSLRYVPESVFEFVDDIVLLLYRLSIFSPTNIQSFNFLREEGKLCLSLLIGILS